MTTAALILAVWGVLASLVCAFVAGASRGPRVEPSDAPLPVWLELFDRQDSPERVAQAPAVEAPAAPATPASTPVHV